MQVKLEHIKPIVTGIGRRTERSDNVLFHARLVGEVDLYNPAYIVKKCKMFVLSVGGIFYGVRYSLTDAGLSVAHNRDKVVTLIPLEQVVTYKLKK